MSSIYGQGRQNEGYYTHHSSGRWQRGRGRGRQVTYSDRQPGIIYQDNQQQQSRLYHSGPILKTMQITQRQKTTLRDTLTRQI